MSVNKVILIGHVGSDVNMHHFDNGNCIANFTLATNESYKSKQTGEIVKSTEWHSISVRNKLAEICNKYLSKGDKVYLEGTIKSRSWTSKEGIERQTKEIHAKEVNFLTNKNESSSNNNPAETPTNNTSQEDDLPF